MTAGNVSIKRSTADFVGSDLHFCPAGIRTSSRHTWLHRSTGAWVWRAEWLNIRGQVDELPNAGIADEFVRQLAETIHLGRRYPTGP